MHVDRLSITLDPRLAAAARKAAKRSNDSLSAWIAEATADRVRNEALGQALDQWEAEQGTFTSDELSGAAAKLGRRRQANRRVARQIPDGGRRRRSRVAPGGRGR